MTNKYLIALALMFGVVFAGHASAQMTPADTTAEKAKTEAAKAADETAAKPEDAEKAEKKGDEKAASEKDAKKDVKKEGAIQSCGQASTENEGDEE